MKTPRTPRDRVLAALRGQRVRPVPAGAVTQTATVAQMDALGASWPEAHRDPALLARLAAGAHTVLGFDLVRVPFDQTIEAELLGAEVSRGDRISNCSVRGPLLSPGDPLPSLPDARSGRAGALLEAIALLRRELGEEVAVLGGLVGPFTLVTQILGLSRTLAAALLRPMDLVPSLDLAVRLGIEYGRLQVAAGADAVCIDDMASSLDLTSPSIFEKVILPAQRCVVAGIGAPVVLHICGRNTAILDLLRRTGAAALSLEARSDLRRAVAGGGPAIVGGVPTMEVLLGGTAGDVRRSAEECLAAGVHLLAPGCGIPPATATENLLELRRAAEEWR